MPINGNAKRKHRLPTFKPRTAQRHIVEDRVSELWRNVWRAPFVYLGSQESAVIQYMIFKDTHPAGLEGRPQTREHAFNPLLPRRDTQKRLGGITHRFKNRVATMQGPVRIFARG